MENTLEKFSRQRDLLARLLRKFFQSPRHDQHMTFRPVNFEQNEPRFNGSPPLHSPNSIPLVLPSNLNEPLSIIRPPIFHPRPQALIVPTLSLHSPPRYATKVLAPRLERRVRRA